MKTVQKSPFLTNLRKSFEGFSTKAGWGYGKRVMAGMREKLSKELQTNYKKDIRRENTEEQLTVQQQPRLPCSCVLLLHVENSAWPIYGRTGGADDVLVAG
jgi:hypothetical protein